MDVTDTRLPGMPDTEQLQAECLARQAVIILERLALDQIYLHKVPDIKHEPKLCTVPYSPNTYITRHCFHGPIHKFKDELIGSVGNDQLAVVEQPRHDNRRWLRPRLVNKKIVEFFESSDDENKLQDCIANYVAKPSSLARCEEDGDWYIHDSATNEFLTKSSRNTKKGGPLFRTKKQEVDLRRNCPECSDGFATLQRLMSHIRNVHGGLRCLACGRIFTNPERFNKHKEQRHGNNDAPTLSQVRILWTPKDIICFYCGDKFTSVEEQVAHRKIHSGKNEMHVCKLCGVTLKGLLGLRHHVMKVHLGFPHRSTEKRRTKKYTDKNLPIPEDVLATLVKVPTIHCDVCGKKFYWEYKLLAHKEREHHQSNDPDTSKSSRYACNICGLLCRAPSFLRSHARVHTGERPFICDACGATYRTSHILRKHISKNHPEITLPRQFEYGGENPLSDRSVVWDVFADIPENSEGLLHKHPLAAADSVTNHEIAEALVRNIDVECDEVSYANIETVGDPLWVNESVINISASSALLPSFVHANDELRSPGDQFPVPEDLDIDQKPRSLLPAVSTIHIHVDAKTEPGYLTRASVHSRTQVSQCVEVDSRIRKLNQKRKRTQQLDELHTSNKHKRKQENCYKCRLTNCRFRAPDADALAAHRLNVHGRTDLVRSYKFKCDFDGCTFRARYQESLDSHVLRHQVNEQKVDEHALNCRVDNCNFNATNQPLLASHHASQHGRSSKTPLYAYKCDAVECNFRAQCENSLKSHSQSHLNPQQTTPNVSAQTPSAKKKKVTHYFCTFTGCGKIFTHRIRLVGHIDNIHHGKAKMIQDAKNPWFKRAVMCRMKGCFFKTRKRSEMDSHRATFHNSVSGLSSVIISTQTKIRNQASTIKHPCQFPNCKYKALLIESLELHIRKVHHKLPILRHFKCLHCPKSFRSNYYREIHLKLKHTGDDSEKPRHHCKYCQKEFCNRHVLIGHIQRYHPESQTFPCNICGKVFYEENENRNHEVRHSSYPETPFRCACYCCTEICSSLHELQQHVRDVHDASIDTRILCPTCGKNVIARNFANHRQSHKNMKAFACHLCPKTFRRRCDLERHSELQHSHIVFRDQKKTESCRMCDVTFWTKAALKKHEYSHKRKLLNAPIKRTISVKEKNEATALRRRQRKRQEKIVLPSLPQSLGFIENCSGNDNSNTDLYPVTLVSEVLQNQGQMSLAQYHAQYNSLPTNFFPPLSSTYSHLPATYNNQDVGQNLYQLSINCGSRRFSTDSV